MNFKAALLQQLEKEKNSHLQGIKQVFIQNSDTDSALTQLAYGCMLEGQESGLHFHETMDEYFFFLKGTAVYEIDGQAVNVSPSSFFRVPAGIPHNLIHTGKEPLEFVYFGIDTMQ